MQHVENIHFDGKELENYWTPADNRRRGRSITVSWQHLHHRGQQVNSSSPECQGCRNKKGRSNLKLIPLLMSGRNWCLNFKLSVEIS